MNTISNVCLKNKRVLIRVDFNVPLDENLVITDDSRMVSVLPTIKKVVSDGGMAIIMSHLGRPKNGFEEKLSLKHTTNHLSFLLNRPVSFGGDCIGERAVNDVVNMSSGDILVLENLRFYREEQNGDEEFAKKLARLGDVYVNDAFGTAHRAHASTAVIAKFFPKNKYFGLLMSKELGFLQKTLNNKKKPFTAIIGGAKIAGKIDIIKSLFDKVDNLIIGGGMAYTFAKAMGGKVGNSLVENEKVVLAKQLIKEAQKKGVNLLLPTDSVNADSFSNDANTTISSILSIEKTYMGLDLGGESIAVFSETIKNSKVIIWNGPMGVFEMSNFENGTKKIGEAICLATESGAFSLVGGGDSVAALNKFGFGKRVSYVSTGGGAMLDYLEGKKLPGVLAILD